MSDTVNARNPLQPPRAYLKEGDLSAFLSAACIYSAFFSGYLYSSFPGYAFGGILILLRLHKLRLTAPQVVSIALLAAYVVCSVFVAESPQVVLMNFRFWYGWVFFCLFFLICSDGRLTTPGFFYLVCATVIVEAILINTFVDPLSLPNSPYGEEDVSTAFFGFYKRPLCFTGNPTMSAGALVTLFYLFERSNPGKVGARQWGLFLTCLALLASATGFVLFVLLLLLKAMDKRIVSFFWILLGIFLLGVYFILVTVDIEDFRVLSLAYYSLVYESKFELVSDLFEAYSSPFSALLGAQVSADLPMTAGDFGWYYFLQTCGFAGIAIFFFSVYSFYRPGLGRIAPILLLFIGTLHYPVAMSPTGQLLLAFVLVSSARCFGSKAPAR